MKKSTSETIRIIITGGTFDKEYDAIKGDLTFQNSHLPEIVKTVRPTLSVELEVNQLIDSLDMAESNRISILDSCRRAREERIIITHGTDTMAETASIIGSARLEKTIILTGAMIPYTVAGSDAVFNLGCSFSAVQLLEYGVYIVMNGRIFNYDNVRKNRERGFFESLKG